MRAVDRLMVGLDVECRLKATELRQTGRRSLNEGRIIDGGQFWDCRREQRVPARALPPLIQQAFLFRDSYSIFSSLSSSLVFIDNNTLSGCGTYSSVAMMSEMSGAEFSFWYCTGKGELTCCREYPSVPEFAVFCEVVFCNMEFGISIGRWSNWFNA